MSSRIMMLVFFLMAEINSLSVSNLTDDKRLFRETIKVDSHHRLVKRESQSGGSDQLSSCSDLHESCEQWSGKGYCTHDVYRRFMKKKCKNSCKLCEGDGVPTKKLVVCKDMKEACVYWSNQGYCHEQLFREYMSVNCKESCGLCIAKSSIDLASSSFSKTQPVTKATKISPTTSLISSKTTFHHYVTDKNKLTSNEPSQSSTTLKESITAQTLNFTSYRSLAAKSTAEAIAASPDSSKSTASTAIELPTTRFVPTVFLKTTPAYQKSTAKHPTTLLNRITSADFVTTADEATPESKEYTTKLNIVVPTLSSDSTITTTTIPTENNLMFATTRYFRQIAATSMTSTETAVDLQTTRKEQEVENISLSTMTSPYSDSMKSFVKTSSSTIANPAKTTTLASATSMTAPLTSTTSQSLIKPTVLTQRNPATLIMTTQNFVKVLETKILPTSSTQNKIDQESTSNYASFSNANSSAQCYDAVESCDIIAFLCPWDPLIRMQCRATCNQCHGNSSEALSNITDFDVTEYFTEPPQTTENILIGITTGNFKNTANSRRLSTSSSLMDDSLTLHSFPVEATRISNNVTESTKYLSALENINANIPTQSMDLSSPTTDHFPDDQSAEHLQPTQQTWPANYWLNHTFKTTTSFPTTTQSIQSQVFECSDVYDECDKIFMYCHANVNVSINCKKTCGLCKDNKEISTLDSTTDTPVQPNITMKCEDRFAKCFELQSECNRPESTSFLSITCRKTCGFCEVSDSEKYSLVKESSHDCQDDNAVCESWAQSGFCDSAIYPELNSFMQTNCRKSCKMCEVISWTTWTECSLSCGGGEQTRQKSVCINGTCTYSTNESRFCSLEVCPENPGVCEDRLSTRTCEQNRNTNSCETGIIKELCAATCGFCQSRNFVTTSTPASECFGCDLIVWLSWGPWSHCNASCNGGMQTRRRSCSLNSCIGENTDYIACNSFSCHSCYDQSPTCPTLERFGACRKIAWKFFCKLTCGMCTPTPIEGRCADADVRCSNSSNQCLTPAVAQACPVTCGRCAPPKETVDTIPADTYHLESNCVDQHSSCPEASAQGYCSVNRIAQACPDSCGQCKKKFVSSNSIHKHPVQNKTTEKCSDQWNICSELKFKCNSSELVEKSCPLTCEKCSNFYENEDKENNAVIDQDCVDQKVVCPLLARNNQCDDPTVAVECKLSCDRSCSKVSYLPTTTSTSIALTSANPVCTDNHENCGEYHALGRCQNEFIRFLCPLSCMSCEPERERILPTCDNVFGKMCTALASQCSNAIVKFGCEKTCGICQDQISICMDALAKECQELGKYGMCSVNSFRRRCPVTCDACEKTDPQEEAYVESSFETSCNDLVPTCTQLSSLCERQSMMQTICKRTCNLCEQLTKEKKSNLPCLDLNPDKCPRLMTLGQCTLPGVAFMCAKSCKSCVSSVKTCKDSLNTCQLSKALCSLDSIATQCPRTCGKCGSLDRERTYKTAMSAASSKSYYECDDYIEECSDYKSYCGIYGWLEYMDVMCPNACGVCGMGTWTKWSSWSGCSKPCNDDPGPLNADSGGNRTRTRECVDGRYCAGGEAVSVEIGKCNKDRCPHLARNDPFEGYKIERLACCQVGKHIDAIIQYTAPQASCLDQPRCEQWEQEGRCRVQRYQSQMKVACPIVCGYCTPDVSWSSWGECDAPCGPGKQNRTTFCPYKTCKEAVNGSRIEIRNCTNRESCDGWSSWSPWSPCSSTCGIGSQLRIRICNEGNIGGVMCRGSDLHERVCEDNFPCPAWSKWSSWSECDLTCGNGTKTRKRICHNKSAGLKCKGNSSESSTCNEFSCSEWMDWGSWGDCSVSCGGEGLQYRYRVCPGIAGTCGPKNGSRDNRVCGKEACSTWTTWSDWSDCSVTCGEGGIQKRSRNCLLTEENLSLFRNSSTPNLCSGSPDDMRECSSKEICIRWTLWSEFSDCSATCGKGFMTRTRNCNPVNLDEKVRDEICPGESVEKVLCNCNICPDVGVWSPWGSFLECSVSCGGNGEKIRRRICFDGIPGRGGCQGPSLDIAECGQDSCPIGRWDPWSSWSDCSATCGYSERTRRRECVGGKEGISGCMGYGSLSEECSLNPCPSWSEWNSWSTCSVSCGKTGIRSREKQCYDSFLEETVFESHCDFNNKTNEKEECNVHECPSWGAWKTWSDCSASCGVGLRNRERICKYGNIGDLGCHEEHHNEQILCNEWDCPASCQTVALKMKWQVPNNNKTKEEIEDDDIIEKDKVISSLQCFSINETDRWVKVQFRRPRVIAGIYMQGFHDVINKKYSWVKRFLVFYGENEENLLAISDNTGRPRLFDGPNGPIETVKRYWEPVQGKIWKIQILSSQPPQWVCMRSALQRCGFSDELVYSMEGSGIMS